MATDKLSAYHAKRDFKKTKERAAKESRMQPACTTI
ncbi:hypothetical protein N181_24250 [Sinorhizobium fredii USDA 205]|nr:hypothetical protein N181_24250 [Sinorhizobium fredii USDA 205]